MSGRGRRVAAGFSLIEAVISVVLVAVMFAAVVQTVGASRIVGYKTEGHRRGSFLGRQLLAEILQQAYQDPDGPAPLGVDTSELALDRELFDDVDDYDGWYASPPEDPDGSTEPDQDDWSREVRVVWVNPADVGQGSGVETGAKRIVVTVKHKGMVMSELTAVRTKAFPRVDR